MLMLKCSVCLDILNTPDCRPVAAPCGHIYCQQCLGSMARTRQQTNCAFCRQAFPITAVVPLYVEFEKAESVLSPPLTLSQQQAGEFFLEDCARAGNSAGEEETLQRIVTAENIVLDMEKTHGGTSAEHLLKQIHVSLEEFRKRLKLFSRVNALEHKNTELQQERESLRQAVVNQLKEAEDAAKSISKLERRLERKHAELEACQSQRRRELQDSNQTIQEVRGELQAERSVSSRYKKKYYIASKELKQINARERGSSNNAPGTSNSETDISDASLEIEPPPKGKHSPAVMKASLRRQISSNSATSAGFFGDSNTKQQPVARSAAGVPTLGYPNKRTKRPTVLSPDLDVVREVPRT